MTISDAFNEIAVKLGGEECADATIVGAIDALNDVLAGSDQQRAETIEDAVRMLGGFIGGGSDYELHIESLLSPIQSYVVACGGVAATLQDSTWFEDGETIEGKSCMVRAGEIVVVQSASSLTVQPKYLGGYIWFTSVPCVKSDESGVAWAFVMPSHEVSCLVS